jgi:hypothetical protein
MVYAYMCNCVWNINVTNTSFWFLLQLQQRSGLPDNITGKPKIENNAGRDIFADSKEDFGEAFKEMQEFDDKN